MSSFQQDLTEEQVRRASEAIVDAVLFIRQNADQAPANEMLQCEREKLVRAVMHDPTITGWLLSDTNFQVH